MKVKIVRCSGDYWYKDKIGELFEVIDYDKKVFFVRSQYGKLGYVYKADTIPVNEIRYEISKGMQILTTRCKMNEYCMVGSVLCAECKYNCGIDESEKTVQCSWQKGSKEMDYTNRFKKESDEMKRLDIRKDYMDNKIEIVTHYSDGGLEYLRVRLLNDSDIKIIMRIGEKYSITLNQVNAILKVMGLNYELYESVNWQEVEEGAEVKFRDNPVVDGLVIDDLVYETYCNFHSYIPNLNKIIVIVGDKVKVVDEDKVKLV